MDGPLLRLLILFRSVNNYGCRKQFLFLVGQFQKYLHFGKMFYQFHAARRTNSYIWVVFKHSTQHQGIRSGLVACVQDNLSDLNDYSTCELFFQ